MTCSCGTWCEFQDEKILEGGGVLKTHWKCPKCSRVITAVRAIPYAKGGGLDERNAQIISLRLEHGWPLQRIADDLGITKQRVYEIIERAKEKAK